MSPDHAAEAVGARPGNRRAALVLVVLTPVIAELTWGLIPLSMAWLVLLLVPVYGAGILLVREAVRRTGRGWPSIVLLGVAYELVEDGIGLQALSSPTLYGAAEWGPRVLGLNVPYWEANVVYHVLFSAVIPILITELLFPAHRHVPFLKRTGLAFTAVVALAGVGVLRLAIPPSMDPGYVAPLPVVLGCVIAVAVLAVVALRIVPPRSVRQPTATLPPPRWAMGPLGAVGAFVLLGLLFPIGASGQPAFTEGNWVIVAMLATVALVTAIILVIRRWARSATWSDRHALLLAGGAVIGHTIFGAFSMAGTDVDRYGLLGVAVLMVVLIGFFDRRVAQRSLGTPDLHISAVDPQR